MCFNVNNDVQMKFNGDYKKYPETKYTHNCQIHPLLLIKVIAYSSSRE